jgi:membrane protein DedA with SNARE-associated domain
MTTPGAPEQVPAAILTPALCNFLTAKAVAVYIIPIITGMVFYGYSAIIGEEILIVDILIFLVAIVVGQLTSYKITTSVKLLKYTNAVSLIFIIV